MISSILLFFGKYGIFLLIVISLINYKKERKTLIAFILSTIVSYAISAFYYTPRPFVKESFAPLIAHSANSSFPSKNASVGFSLSFSTFKTSNMLGMVSLAIAILMSVGRVYAGIHYLTDIIAGVVIGALCSYAAYSKTTDNILRKNKILKKIFLS